MDSGLKVARVLDRVVKLERAPLRFQEELVVSDIEELVNLCDKHNLPLFEIEVFHQGDRIMGLRKVRQPYRVYFTIYEGTVISFREFIESDKVPKIIQELEKAISSVQNAGILIEDEMDKEKDTYWFEFWHSLKSIEGTLVELKQHLVRNKGGES